MSINLKKINIGRRRFLKTSPLQFPLEWLSELAKLKDFIATSTSFQIVGSKVYFEISTENTSPKMLLEVLGTPVPLDGNALVMSDQEACEVLVHKLEGGNLFEMDFDQLISASMMVYKGLENTFRNSDSGICHLFHIVYDNEKIELHFFIQKDYIQKQS